MEKKGKKNYPAVIGAVAILAILVLSVFSYAKDEDITGIWRGAYSSIQYPGEIWLIEFDLEQTSNEVSGTMILLEASDSDCVGVTFVMEGTVEGNKVYLESSNDPCFDGNLQSALISEGIFGDSDLVVGDWEIPLSPGVTVDKGTFEMDLIEKKVSSTEGEAVAGEGPYVTSIEEGHLHTWDVGSSMTGPPIDISSGKILYGGHTHEIDEDSMMALESDGHTHTLLTDKAKDVGVVADATAGVSQQLLIILFSGLLLGSAATIIYIKKRGGNKK